LAVAASAVGISAATGSAVTGGAAASPLAVATAAIAPAAEAATPVAAQTPAGPYQPFELAIDYDFLLQPNYYYCGPAATRIAVTAHGSAVPSLDDIAWLLGTTTNGTNSAADTTRVLNRLTGANFYQTRLIRANAATAAEMDRLRLDVVNAINYRYAVVANIVGSAVDTGGHVHSYGGGHYLTVVGYGQGGLTMKIADPADTTGNGSYWMSTINLANWIAARGYSA
jgi:hypothetical protein